MKYFFLFLFLFLLSPSTAFGRASSMAQTSIFVWMHLVAFLLFFFIAVQWVSKHPKKKPILLICLSGIVIAGLAAFLPTDQMLARGLVILHEGNSYRMIRALYGHTHAEEGFHQLWHALSSDSSPPILTLLRINIGVTIISFSLVSTWVLLFIQPKIRWFFLLFLLGLGSPFLILPAWSELPSAILNFYFALGILPYVLLYRSTEGNALKYASLTLLFLLSALMICTRREMLILVFPALVITSIITLQKGEILGILDAKTRKIGNYFIAHPGSLFLLFLLCIVLERIIISNGGSELRWITAAINPLGASFLRIPPFLAKWTSIGFSLLFCLGWLYALKNWIQFAGIPIAMLLLFRMYISASHRVDWELFRYISHLNLPIFLLVISGVIYAQKRIVDRKWQAAGPWFLLLLCLTGGGHELKPNLFVDVEAQAEQREARFVMQNVMKYPECRFIAPFKERQKQGVLIFGGGQDLLIVNNMRQVQSHVSDQNCLLFYRSLDCHLIDGPDCSFGKESELLESLSYLAQRYSDNEEYGHIHTDVRLMVMRYDHTYQKKK